jgi:hypothetical protein
LPNSVRNPLEKAKKMGQERLKNEEVKNEGGRSQHLTGAAWKNVLLIVDGLLPK